MVRFATGLVCIVPLVAGARGGSHQLPIFSRGRVELAPPAVVQHVDAVENPGAVHDSTASTESCLCTFDIDRTLTAHQTRGDVCPGNQVVEGIQDTAYSKGTLRLGEVGALGVAATKCSPCYVAVISRGDASGQEAGETTSAMARHIQNVVMTPVFRAFVDKYPEALTWSEGHHGHGEGERRPANSPFVVSEANNLKAKAASEIVEWYRARGVTIPAQRVYFFDDHTQNIEPFKEFGYNAAEISCMMRAPRDIGFCGATVDEVNELLETGGANQCKARVQAEEPGLRPPSMLGSRRPSTSRSRRGSRPHPEDAATPVQSMETIPE